MLKKLADSVREHSVPLRDNDDLDVLVDKIGDARLVLLGEASHGTSEFYQVRAELSKKLIQDKGFSIIAVEGDWPASQKLNGYIKGYDTETKTAKEVLKSFNRWPTWMWANEEIAGFAEWLKDHNRSYSGTPKVGFYGIDVYSLWESMEEVVRHLEKTNSPDLSLARKAFSCFEPFNRNHEKYAISSAVYSEGCVEEVTKLLQRISESRDLYQYEEESILDIKVNALVTANAERYYSTMIFNDEKSWNIRDLHMVEALNEVMDFYGSDSKVIVWEHNTHVGDARATDMANQGLINVGQVLREQNRPEDVYIVGFGTHSGTVIAADEWGVNLEEKTVPQAKLGSWEDVLHRTGDFDKMLFFDQGNRHLFSSIIGHRAIGVVYNPEYEHLGNYVPSVISERYDAFVFIDKSHALTPLNLYETVF
ncbi:erythromycin esterase family protein [Peribacillus glennii]|uniref:Erythromycin esterase family protein n=1 Tax=Peribacillus glennii TaxID=2303991 RepID=A0A372L774_9BACI|nr:erythromycin esterase family protein [Peribacillus glennii]RFU61056.1 erythromycin esterase family protein [Peribacillus glennii]